MAQRVFERAAWLEERNIAFALATIVSSRGSVPRKSARMLIEEDGSATGTLGGHAIEKVVVESGKEALASGCGRLVAVDGGHGRIEVMIDVVQPIKRAYIIGYGHVGRALAKSLHSVGYAVHIYDISEVDCPFAAKVRTGESWQSILSGEVCDTHTALVITTHDKDEALSLLDTSKAFYIGAISSRSRVLPGKGISMPMGLDIGSETPEELAISVTAEIMRAYSRKSGLPLSERRRRLVVVRGAGDLATATIIRLARAGYDVVATETAQPTQIRRNVSFAEAVYEGRQSVDGMEAVLVDSPREVWRVFDEHRVPILIDPDGSCIEELKPTVVVDAIIAKKNLGTKMDMAPLTIALGPGFVAGEDVDVVIETSRGHNLAKIIRKGPAKANTGIPGNIAGYTTERVVRSSASGIFTGLKTFGDIVKKGEVIATVGDVPQRATIDAMVRGMLHSGLEVTEGFKIADIDPRGEGVEYNSPSDKARAIAGAVLEAVDAFFAEVM